MPGDLRRLQHPRSSRRPGARSRRRSRPTPPRGVGTCACLTTRPSRSMRPAAMCDPPTSTPTAYMARIAPQGEAVGRYHGGRSGISPMIAAGQVHAPARTMRDDRGAPRGHRPKAGSCATTAARSGRWKPGVGIDHERCCSSAAPASSARRSAERRSPRASSSTCSIADSHRRRCTGSRILTADIHRPDEVRAALEGPGVRRRRRLDRLHARRHRARPRALPRPRRAVRLHQLGLGVPEAAGQLPHHRVDAAAQPVLGVLARQDRVRGAADAGVPRRAASL